MCSRAVHVPVKCDSTMHLAPVLRWSGGHLRTSVQLCLHLSLECHWHSHNWVLSHASQVSTCLPHTVGGTACQYYITHVKPAHSNIITVSVHANPLPHTSIFTPLPYDNEDGSNGWFSPECHLTHIHFYDKAASTHQFYVPLNTPYLLPC